MDDDTPVFTPEDYIRYEADRQEVPPEQFRVPSRLILLYQKRAFDHVSQGFDRKKDWLYGSSRPISTGVIGNKELGVFRAWVGASAAAAMLEELIACGVESICEVGIAGGLQLLKPGDIVVVTEAIRDEGTSKHYYPPEVRVEASPRLKSLLIRHLTHQEIKYHVGPVWTTDGVYRETYSKLLIYRNQGALAVNMESAALFAVAKYRDIEIASIQVISDVLSEKGWKPAFRQKKVFDSVRTALDVGIKALVEV